MTEIAETTEPTAQEKATVEPTAGERRAVELRQALQGLVPEWAAWFDQLEDKPLAVALTTVRGLWSVFVEEEGAVNVVADLSDLDDEITFDYGADDPDAVTAVVAELKACGAVPDTDLPAELQAADRRRLRASWTAMSCCLHRLARHQPLDPLEMADIPDAHRTYLLGHQASQQHTVEAYRRLQEAAERVGALLPNGTEVGAHVSVSSDDLWAVLQVLRGEQPDRDGEADADGR